MMESEPILQALSSGPEAPVNVPSSSAAAEGTVSESTSSSTVPIVAANDAVAPDNVIVGVEEPQVGSAAVGDTSTTSGEAALSGASGASDATASTASSTRSSTVQEDGGAREETGEDSQISTSNSNEDENSVDVDSLGGIGRIFGAVFSRFGHIPFPTQVSQEVLVRAKDICESEALSGSGAPDDRLMDLVWGWEFEGRVDRQTAAFFRMTVDERQAKNGVVVSCRSSNKGKFKLLVFDHQGNVVHHEDSRQSILGGITESTLYFTSFDMYHLGQPLPDALKEENIPDVFGALDDYRPCKLNIQKGQHLICVYGDNFLGKTFFSLCAVPALKPTDEEVKTVQSLDAKVMEKKESLKGLKDEFVEARARYEDCLRRVKEETSEVTDLVNNREAAYVNFLQGSLRAYLPAASDDTSSEPADAARYLPSSRELGISAVRSAASWVTGVAAGGGALLTEFMAGSKPGASPFGDEYSTAGEHTTAAAASSEGEGEVTSVTSALSETASTAKSWLTAGITSEYFTFLQ